MFPPLPPSRRPTREERLAREAVELSAADAAAAADQSMRADPGETILARIIDIASPTSGQAVYQWEYAVARDAGKFARDPAGFKGDAAVLPAWEVTGNTQVPLDGSAIVELHESAGGLYYSFFWPSPGMYAILTAYAPPHGMPPRPARYGWEEILAERGGNIADNPGGRSGAVGLNPAYEINNRRIPIGTKVYLSRGYGAAPDLITTIAQHGDGIAVWPEHAIFLENAVGGSFTLTLFDATGNSATTAPIPTQAGVPPPPTVIQAAIVALPGWSHTTVTGLGTQTFPWLIALRDTFADVAPILGDPFALEGVQEWLFDAAPEQPGQCTDVNLDVQTKDAWPDCCTLTRLTRTLVYLCGVLQFPLPPWTVVQTLYCCSGSGSDSGSDSGSTSGSISGSGSTTPTCPCPSPPVEVTLYAAGIANGGCTDCAALAAGIVLVATAPCVWQGTDGGVVCAGVDGFGALTFELFYSDGLWQLLIWYTTATGQLVLAAVYTASDWDCIGTLTLTLTYDGNGPCIWPPVMIIVPGPPGSGPYWCVQVDSGSGVPCCPCWAAYASTAGGDTLGTVHTSCCPDPLANVGTVTFGGAFAGLGAVTVKYIGLTSVGETWQGTATGCGSTVTVEVSCYEPDGYFTGSVRDNATGAVIAVMQWGNGFGITTDCTPGALATLAQYTGPPGGPCDGAFTAALNLGGGDGSGCGPDYTAWGAVQYCLPDGSRVNQTWFDGSKPCLTIIGYYPSESEAAAAAATFVATGTAPAPSAPCGPDCEGSGSDSGSGSSGSGLGSASGTISGGGAYWCCQITGAGCGHAVGETACFNSGAATWTIGESVVVSDTGGSCIATVMSGPYTDATCAGTCAAGPPAVGWLGMPGALLCLPQSALTGTLAVGGAVSGPWGTGTIVNGPWPGPDCGGECGPGKPPPPPPCCYPMGDEVWLTCGGMLAGFGSILCKSITPGSGVGPWRSGEVPIGPAACGWITLQVSCDKKTGLFRVQAVLFRPSGTPDLPPEEYAGLSCTAQPASCVPLLASFTGAPKGDPNGVIEPIGDGDGPCALAAYKFTLTD